MISFLKGIVSAKEDRYIVLILDDTIGYRVYVTNRILEAISFNQEIALYIYTYVREDALDLYGFPTMKELEFFELLISISGVGPKSALGVLSVASIDELKKAIIHGDPKLLQKVSSIGKKIAERIIVDLKEKISVGEKDDLTGVSITENVQLLDALVSLGYKESEVRKTIQAISPDSKDLSERIKEALRILSAPK